MFRYCAVLILLLSLSYSFAKKEGEPASSLEIVQLERITSLLSHTTRNECLMKILNKHNGPVEWLDFVLPLDQEPILAFIGAYAASGKRESMLKKEFIGRKYGPYFLTRFFFTEPLLPNSMIDVKVTWVTGGEHVPNPPKVKQGTDHRYLFKTSATFISPYLISKQTYKIMVSPAQLKGYTTLDGLTKIETGLLYNNGKQIPPMHSTPIEVFFVNNFPNLVVTEFLRRVTLSHWHGSIQIEEFYDVTNASPKLSDEFSRVDYAHSFYRQGAVYPLQVLHVQLPKDNYFVTYRDEVGNISTSHLRPEKEYDVLEISPRYPVFGGWNFSFELSYYLPIENNVKYENEGSYALSLDLAYLFNDVCAKKFTLQIILPDGSEITKIRIPSHSQQEDHVSTVWSYLDLMGRPCYTLKTRNLVRDSIGQIQLEYRYSFFKMVTKLLLLIGSFFVLFSAMVVYKRTKFQVFQDNVSIRASLGKETPQTPTKPKTKRQ